MDDGRAALLRLSAARGESLAELSRMLRRNAAYLQQYVQRGTPRRLAEADARLLADHFGVAAVALGGAADAGASLVPVPYLAVRAAAGRGIAADETLIRPEPFARSVLREVGIAPEHAALVTAAGDSMAPTIMDGDRLLIDRGDAHVGEGGSGGRGRGELFVFRRDDLLSVKRVARTGRRLTLASDNPDYPGAIVGAEAVAIIGRVKLLLRRPE